jgi:hypothetical protein
VLSSDSLTKSPFCKIVNALTLEESSFNVRKIDPKVAVVIVVVVNVVNGLVIVVVVVEDVVAVIDSVQVPHLHIGIILCFTHSPLEIQLERQ